MIKWFSMGKLVFKTFIFLFVFVKAADLQGQGTSIEWLSWEQAMEKQKKEKRKIFVDVVTEWCAWCKKMDRDTYTEKKVIEYMNKNYYSVKLDGQRKGDIVFRDRIYKFIDRGKDSYHEFAAMIMNGRLEFPTIVFFDENVQLIQPLPGYRSANELESILTYFGENIHKKIPWSSYMAERKKLTPKEPVVPQVNVGNNKH